MSLGASAISTNSVLATAGQPGYAKTGAPQFTNFLGMPMQQMRANPHSGVRNTRTCFC